jgi:twitching motility protein PilT
MPEVSELLTHLLEMRASDLHLKAGSPPFIRLNTRLQPTDLPVLTAADMTNMAHDVLPPNRAADFEVNGESDFALSVSGVGRFRVSVVRQRGSVGIVFRRVVTTVPTFDALGFPPPIRQLAERRSGLLLVTGPSDSGKSTTIATMLDHINQHAAMSVITIEDPIEFLHADRKAFISQREVGTDTRDAKSGFARSLRHDPDVIYIDRLADAELMATVLSAASGRLIISTLSTLNASDTIARIIDFFPPHQARQARHSLAAVLQGVISQRLLERQDGKGRVAAFELMVATPRIHDTIVEAPGSQELESLIETGEYNGMQTMDQHLTELYRTGMVSMRDALSASSHPRDLRVILQQMSG